MGPSMSSKSQRVRIPSLQHFCALLGGDAASIEQELLRSKKIPVSYHLLRTLWLLDLVRLGVSPNDVRNACSRLKGKQNILSNREALEVLLDFLRESQPSHLHLVEKTYFPIGR